MNNQLWKLVILSILFDFLWKVPLVFFANKNLLDVCKFHITSPHG